MLTYTQRVLILVLLAVAAAVGFWMRPPIPQSLAYHNFADQRTLLGIPHCLNVVSNVVFLYVGVVGLAFLCSRVLAGETTLKLAYGVFFLGVGLTSFGSAYYHLDPNNARLFWDRLPMAVAFMGLFAAILTERVSRKGGAFLLIPLLAAGVLSTLYWRDYDDLRPYYYIQFFPLAVLPLVLILFPPRYTSNIGLLIALGWYVVAKFCESPFDGTILDMGHVVSGHTLKHLAAAMGAYQILRMLRKTAKSRPLAACGACPT